MTIPVRWRQAGVLLVLVFIAVTAASWLLKKEESQITLRPEGAGAVDSFNWSVGVTQRYRLAFESSMIMRADSSAPVQVIPVFMTGRLTLHTLDVSPGSTLQGMQLSDVQLTISGKSDIVANDVLEVPFRTRLESGGIPVAMEFPATVDHESRLILENLLKTFQITLLRMTDNWTAAEVNSSGNYLADYTRTGPLELLKTKHGFRANPDNPMLVGATIASTEMIHMDPDKSWIVSMQVDETLKTPGHSGPSLEITNHASLELDTSEALMVSSATWDFTASDTPEEASAPPATTAKTPAMSPDEARTRLLSELPALDNASKGRTLHIHRIRDLLRAHGTMPTTLAQLMATREFTDRTRADLYLALELAGTPEAQAALVSIMSDPSWSLKDGVRAIIALAGVASPDPDAIDALWQTAEIDQEQLASTALFALGSMGGTLNDASSPDYTALRDNLLGYAYSSSEPQRKADYISALGNTQDKALSDDIADMLGDANAIVRRSAAHSLGLVGTGDSVPILMNTLDKEVDGTVRAAIVESLTQISGNDGRLVAAIVTAIKTEPEERARFAMAGYLEEHLERNSGYKTVLQTLIRTESSKRVRQRLGEALASIVVR